VTDEPQETEEAPPHTELAWPGEYPKVILGPDWGAELLIWDKTIALGDRVAGLIVLLFAELVSRVSELRMSELAGQVFLSLGRDPAVVPEPAASLLSRHAVQR
jgi:hypothetical protein